MADEEAASMFSFLLGKKKPKKDRPLSIIEQQTQMKNQLIEDSFGAYKPKRTGRS